MRLQERERAVFGDAEAALAALARGLAEHTAPPLARWSPARLRVLDRLCGAGHSLPGGDGEIVRLAAPLGLDASASVLVFGGGAGGPARAIAAASGASVWDTASAPEQAEAARTASHALVLDPVRERSAITVLSSVADALGEDAGLAMLQLVADAPFEPDDAETARWCRAEGCPHALPTRVHVTRALAQLGFRVGAVSDESERHVRQVMAAWRVLLAELGGSRPEGVEAAGMVTEAERWLSRVRLLRSGRIRLLRWEARRSAAAETRAHTQSRTGARRTLRFVGIRA